MHARHLDIDHPPSQTWHSLVAQKWNPAFNCRKARSVGNRIEENKITNAWNKRELSSLQMIIQEEYQVCVTKFCPRKMDAASLTLAIKNKTCDKPTSETIYHNFSAHRTVPCTKSWSNIKKIQEKPLNWQKVISRSLGHWVLKHHRLTTKPAIDSYKRLKFVFSVVALLWVQEDLKQKEMHQVNLMGQLTDHRTKACTASAKICLVSTDECKILLRSCRCNMTINKKKTHKPQWKQGLSFEESSPPPQ